MEIVKNPYTDTYDMKDAQARISERYNKNLKFFEEFLPDVYKLIAESKENVSLTMDAKTQRLNKVIDGRTVYPEGAYEFAKEEVTNYLKLKDTYEYRPIPSKLNVNNLIKRHPFFNSVSKYAENFQSSTQLHPVCTDLVIFGIGLGHHVELLCNKGKFWHITIIERKLSNFKESLYTVDWADILKNLKNKHQISFTIKGEEMTDEDYENQIKIQLYKLFPSITASTLIYNHNPELEKYDTEKAIIKDFGNMSKLIYERIGPDGQRLLNTNENIKIQNKTLNLGRTRIGTEKTNVVVVGSGPSLDSYLNTLKKYRDKFFIITSGSSLTTILNANLKPDLHFELEFQNLATTHLEHLNEQHSLKNIELICSIETNPGIPKLFKKAYYFLQETSELASYFHPEFILRFGGLTCTNGASAFINRVTDGDMYLIGLDFAFTDGKHHTKDNISNQVDLPDNLKGLEDYGKNMRLMAQVQDIDVNGKPITTTPAFNSAKQLMQSLISLSNNKYYNCSYGADIAGTQHISVDEFENISSNLNVSKAEFKPVEMSFDVKAVHKRTKETFDVSFDICKQVIESIKNIDGNKGEDACISIKELVYRIIASTSKNQGLHRSTMSMNRLPLLVLYYLANYSDDNSRDVVIKEWLKDYNSYIKHVKKKIYKHIQSGDYYVKEDWLERAPITSKEGSPEEIKHKEELIQE